jgi:hypothetical protein
VEAAEERCGRYMTNITAYIRKKNRVFILKLRPLLVDLHDLFLSYRDRVRSLGLK